MRSRASISDSITASAASSSCTVRPAKPLACAAPQRHDAQVDIPERHGRYFGALRRLEDGTRDVLDLLGWRSREAEIQQPAVPTGETAVERRCCVSVRVTRREWGGMSNGVRREEPTADAAGEKARPDH